MPQPALTAQRQTPLGPHRVDRHPVVLKQIEEPDVNLCLWERAPQTAIEQELAVLAAHQLVDIRRVTSATTFAEDVRSLFLEQALDPDQFAQFRADLEQLAERFFGIVGGGEPRFRVFTTGSDDCRRFHVDRKRWRLLCTYRGPGTEWLQDDQVDREALACCAPNEAILKFGQCSRFEPIWVGLFKGDPDNVGRGLVHRSPAIAAAGRTRVVFCLDA